MKLFGLSKKGQITEDLIENEEALNYMSEEEDDENVGQISVDIVDNGDFLVIIAPIAGVEMDDLELALNTPVLTIRGSRIRPNIASEENLKVSECFWGDFTRNIILPDNLLLEGIKATFEKSVLFIHIPKISQTSGQKIKIETF